MTAVLVISNLEYGGAQRQVVEIANELPQHGFAVHVCSLSGYAPLASYLRARQFHVIPKGWKFDISLIPRLAIFLRRVRADVVHGFLFDANVVVRLAGFLARTPLVIDSERNSNYRLKRRQRLAYTLTNPLRHLCVANSHAGAEFNSRLTRTSLDRYRVVYNGVDVERFRPRDRAQSRRLLGLSDDAYIVGMFASFKPQKNHEMALRAFAHLTRTLPTARFLLVGDEIAEGLQASGVYKEMVMQLIDSLGLSERCTILGNRTDVERVYPACDVVVLPSLFEGTPNVALEAMACGIPVVATDVADNGRVIPNGKAGRIVGVGDVEGLAATLAEMAVNSADTARMSAFARQWIAAEFSRETMAARLASVYRSSKTMPAGGSAKQGRRDRRIEARDVV
jgi:glycosyltransferase involved in cell wall biosynthesis